MTGRLRKQAIYGTGYILVFAGILFLLVRPWLPVAAPRPTPVPTAPTNLTPIIIEQADMVRHGTTVDVVVRLKNPNPRAGIADYPLTMTVKDQAGFTVGSAVVSTYILPGTIQYAAALSIPVSAAPTQVSAEAASPPRFTALSGEWTVPTFASLFKEQTRKTIGDRSIEEYTGVVHNTNSLDWASVEVVGVAFDGQGRVIGIGKTFVGQLAAGEQREFILQWPAPAVPTARVSVLPSTNIFSAENSVRAIGDPGMLR